MSTTNLLNAMDQRLKWMAAAFKGTELIRPQLVRDCVDRLELTMSRARRHEEKTSWGSHERTSRCVC